MIKKKKLMVLKLKEKQIYTVPQKNNRTQDTVVSASV